MKISIGLVQLNSGADKLENLAIAEKSIRYLANKGAVLVMMPEHFNFLGPESLKRENAEELDNSPSLDSMKNLAKELHIYIHVGSFLEKREERIYNTGAVISPTGEMVAIYRKIHLFDVETPGGIKYLESEVVSAGSEVTTFTIGDFVFGMATCYDLRFPELFRVLVQKGVHVFLLPAAFTLQTGRDHWELLLRARAVENLCYVAAAGQWGKASGGNQSYGRSMVIDPWGTVLATASDGVGTVLAELDLEKLLQIRAKFPVLDHMRRDVFQSSLKTL